MKKIVVDEGDVTKVRVLIDVCKLEADYLQRCDKRLFATAMDAKTVEDLPNNDDLAERVDAFVARFGRFQDTLADKLLPEFLKLMQEPPGAMLENLDRAERLGLVASADTWAAVRKLRNRMIHEYVKEASELADALNPAHEHIPMLTDTFRSIKQRITARFPALIHETATLNHAVGTERED